MMRFRRDGTLGSDADTWCFSFSPEPLGYSFVRALDCRSTLTMT